MHGLSHLAAPVGPTTGYAAATVTSRTLRSSSQSPPQLQFTGLYRQLNSSSRVLTQAASSETAGTSSNLEKAIEEAETASQAGEHNAPRSLNPEPALPGAVLPETDLLEGEDHTSAFAESDSKVQAAQEHLKQGANVAVIAEDLAGVPDPDPAVANGAAPSTSSETESDAEGPAGDAALDAASALYLEEADLPLKGAPPMDRLSDRSVVETWLKQRRCVLSGQARNCPLPALETWLGLDTLTTAVCSHALLHTYNSRIVPSCIA